MLCADVGDNEAEDFSQQFLASLKERGFTDTRLIFSDAHMGLTAAIKQMFQGCSWQSCLMYILRILPYHVPKADQSMDSAAMRRYS